MADVPAIPQPSSPKTPPPATPPKPPEWLAAPWMTALLSVFPGVMTAVKEAPEPTVRLDAGVLLRVAHHLQASDDLAFDFLMCLSAVDWKDRFEVVYNLFSFKHRRRLTLNVPLPHDNPSIASMAGVWPAADWHEREAYDLFGVRFEGHPNLRRILLPDDWVGHPLRKDYEFPREYHGVECHEQVSGPSEQVRRKTADHHGRSSEGRAL